MFEIRELLDEDMSKGLISLEHYQVQPFGYTRRSQLIERWFSLDRDSMLDEGNFIAKCDQAERMVDAIMTKTVIPKLPLYLLTLLQSMEAGRSGDFKDSALGYYYQYLLTQAFQDSGVKANQLTELFQYTAHLAAEFHFQQKRELSEAELRDFNTRFSKKWHTVDFVPRIKLLIHARILWYVGGDYAFRYPYIYYFLKGQYLSEKLNEADVREYIDHCCKHLYVRDYANTILFLAHHTNDEFLLNKIIEALRCLFRNSSPVAFNGDTGGIRSLIDDTPDLIYSGESPAKHRKRRSEIKDELDDGHDGLSELEEESKELSLVAQITMLFKTIEILGQVLKNKYAKIQRPQKGALLEELFNGPLRALGDFYRFLEKNPDALVAKIETEIERNGEVKNEKTRKNIARKIVSGIVQIMTFAFVMKAAQGANSDNLLEDVRDTITRNGTLAFKLIDLCINLDSPKALPRNKIYQLYKESQKDLIAERLIKIMILNRLYMFKTNEQDMQWLSAKLNFDIKKQHAITYKANGRRLIK